MNIKTLLFSIILTSLVFPCGGEFDFWAPACNILYKTSYPTSPYLLLLSDNANKGNSDSPSIGHYGNIAEWQKIIPNKTNSELHDIIYGTDTKNSSIKSMFPEIDSAVAEYIDLAKSIEIDSDADYHDQPWSYAEIRKQWENPVPEDDTFQKEYKKFFEETNSALKQRYGFLIVRTLHKSRRYDEALSFFVDNLKNKFPKNEVYYYTIDRLAGCFYAMKKYDNAAFLYMRVYMNSEDRVASAFNSYSFCLDKDADGSSYTSTLNDTIGLIALKGMNSFSYDVTLLDKVYRNDPNNPVLEHLFLRLYKKADKESYNELLRYSVSFMKSDRILSKDFWKTMAAHLSHKNGDNKAALKLISSIEDTATFGNQAEALTPLYRVSSWKTIGAEEESYLAQLFPDKESFPDRHGECWKGDIIDTIQSLYTKQGDSHVATALISKSSNYNSDFRDQSEIDKTELFIKFMSQKPDEKFQQVLYSSFTDSTGAPLKMMMMYKYSAMIYISMKKGDFKKADYYYKKLTEPTYSDLISSDLPIECFSNDLTTYRVIDPDSTFSMESFNLGEFGDTVSQHDAIKKALELEKLTKSTDRLVKARAHYLLGNFICYSHRRGKHYMPTINIKLAYRHFKKALELTIDEEIRGRIHFMMLYCEAEGYRVPNWDYYPKASNDTIMKPKHHAVLKQHYQETAFYEKIIHECYHFGYYSNR